MTKLLPIAFFCLLSACSSFVFGQENNDRFSLESGYSSIELVFEHYSDKEASLQNCNHFDDHLDLLSKKQEANELLVVQDFISSDESTDFNCSGGFCMNENHFHKKGLTIKRQYFYYFLNISC